MGRKFTLIVVLTLVMSLLASSVAFADPPSWVVHKQIEKKVHKLKDITPDYWAYHEVQKMINLGIIGGYSDGTFKPNNHVTREQFAKLLVLSMGLKSEGNYNQTFVDVPKSNMFFNNIETAKEYLTGFRYNGKLYFYPKDKAVREDVTVAIVKAKGLDLVSERAADKILAKYKDADKVSKNLRVYVATAVDAGLLGGYKDRGNWYLGPQDPLKRVEAVLLLYRACDGFEKVVIEEDDDPVKVIIEEDEDKEELTVKRLIPKDGQDDVDVELDQLLVQFNMNIYAVKDMDDVLKGITVYNQTTDEELDIDEVKIDGNKLIIELDDELEYDCDYEVEIADDIIEDKEGNNFDGFSWRFSTSKK